MQFWPRVRAARSYVRIRSVPEGEGLQAFAGYKMGMTQVHAVDAHKTSPTKGEMVALPVTVLECPPLKMYSVRGYVQTPHGLRVKQEAVVAKDKHLARKTSASAKQHPLENITPEGLAEIRVLLHTQPVKTGIGQKKPQVFEVALRGNTPEEQFAAAKELAGKEIKASDLFQEGEYVDIRAVTTGRGYQGPVKRFGIGLKSHKSEKGQRRPGSLGGWSGQQHVMYRVAMAGQTGYHQRAQYNNQILKITDDPAEINIKGGFIGYGEGRTGNEFVLIRGSVPGPSKRMITITKAIRPNKKKEQALPTIEAISLESNQGK